ncbi:MAG: hypothetical protein HS116_28635 [Planctomycetes bacterium]|nr:hypothetical protein [Planctomycetota bacterium]
MRKHIGWLGIAAFTLAGVGAWAASEAETLKNEAVAVLKKGSGLSLDPKEYAECVVKLERAIDALDSSGQSESELAQECNSALYWARKFATIEIIDQIRKERGVKPVGAAPATPATPPKKPDPPEEAAPAMPGGGPDAEKLADAKAKFDAAQRYAQSNTNDDYAIALRWFQVAEQAGGTDYSLKALAFAREAQLRYAQKQKPKSGDPIDGDPIGTDAKTPAPPPPGSPLEQGSALLAQGKHEDAIKILAAAGVGSTDPELLRKLGQAYFTRAQQLKDELMPQYDKLGAEWKTAVKNATRITRTSRGVPIRRFDANNPEVLRVGKEIQTLNQNSAKALQYYDRAAESYKRVLNASKDKKDFEAAAHVGLCYSVRGDFNARMTGRRHLAAFLEDYKPANDLERTLYEFCKTEIARINGR